MERNTAVDGINTQRLSISWPAEMDGEESLSLASVTHMGHEFNEEDRSGPRRKLANLNSLAKMAIKSVCVCVCVCVCVRADRAR